MNKEDFAKINRAVSNVRVNIAFTDGSTFFKGTISTTLEQLALRLKLREMFGNIFNDSALDKLEREYLTLKTKLDREKALKEQRERETWLKEKNEPFNRFCWILRNNLHLVTPQELDSWLNETTIEQREMVYDKFKKLASTRGLGLPKGTIEFGISFLQSLLKAENKEENRKWKKKRFLKLFTKA